MTTLAEKIVAIDAALDRAGLDHAFGGALALAFSVEEPRATRDIDVNVFVPAGQAAEVFAAWPAEVDWSETDLGRATRDGQVRLFWDDTPVDLFLSTHAFHAEARAHTREVPFAGVTIPVLGATELAVFKAFFSRTKDWADIEAMIEVGSVDTHRALGWLVDLLGTDDERVTRFTGLLDHERAVEPRFGLL